MKGGWGGGGVLFFVSASRGSAGQSGRAVFKPSTESPSGRGRGRDIFQFAASSAASRSSITDVVSRWRLIGHD